jgi:hypothetical protein
MVGENMGVFLLRDRAELDAWDARDIVADQRWKSAVPPAHLFRMRFTSGSECYTMVPVGDTRVDREACEVLMMDSSQPAEVSWAAAQVSDSLRHVSREGIAARWCASSECKMESVMNHLTLPALHAEVQGMCFFTELASLKDAIQYLLSKTLNERCQSRRFSVVALRCFEADQGVALQLKKLVLCSLLGNYTTSAAATRPRAECRARLYEILLDQHSSYDGWFSALLSEERGLLVQYCLREFLVFAIRDNPGLCDAVSGLMRLDEFAAITAHAMDALRAYIDARLYEPFSELSRSIVPGAAVDFKPAFGWHRDIAPVLSRCQKAMLAISYRRPKRTLQQCFATVQKKLPMVPNPRLVALYNQQHANADIEAYAGIIGWEQMADVTKDMEMTPVEPGRRSRRGGKKSTPESLAPLTHFVSAEQLSALSDLLKCVLPYSGGDVLKDFLPWLRFFGVPQAVIDYTVPLNEPINEPVLSDERLRGRLLYLREHQPHAYNLIQVITQITEDFQCVRTLSVLPLHYWRNQVDAIQGRFDVIGTGTLLKSMIYLVYCDVCGMMYSLLRDPLSQYKQSYTYGLRDAVVDYTTDEIYCQKNKPSHGGTCGDKPLQHVLILGQVIRYKGDTLLLCPQAGCGMPMVFDPAYCAFNERGVACVDCTRVIHSARYTRRDQHFLETYVALMDTFVACELCGEDLWKPSQMYWYPRNIIVCRKHANAAMRQRLADHGLDVTVASREDIVKRLYELDGTKVRSQRVSLPSSTRVFSHKTKHQRK